MKIAVIGAGYVGLPLGAVLSELGHKVFLVRKNKEKCEDLKKGKVHIFEPGLERLVKKNLKNGRFIPTTDYSQAVPYSDVVFIAVGTPSNPNGEADLSQVKTAAKEVARNLKKGYTVVVNKSTAPPGTTKKVALIIEKNKKKDARFDIAFCPEFLREGSAVSDSLCPDRVVIGTKGQRPARILKKIHQPLKAPILTTGIESAEMIKYAANAYLALRIVFINQIANLCEKAGADVEEVIKGIGMDRRIGSHYWYPGLGYGGSCFPKDVAALSFFAQSLKENDSLFEKMDKLNKSRIARVLKRVQKNFGSFSGKTIAVLGLACKRGTDDARHSSAIEVIKILKNKKAKIKAYDPKAMENAKEILPKVLFCQNAYKTAKGADALFILTDWPEFAKIDFRKIKKLMKGNFIFDSRNLLPRKKLKNLDFIYFGVGR